MNWDAIGAVGEIIGAIAVVVSILYLGRQVREGARATRAETELEAAQMWSEFHARVAHSPDMTRIWDSAHAKPETLSDQDRQRFVWLIAEYFFLVEGLFKQFERGFLSDRTWEPHARTVAGLFENAIVLEWWKSGVSPYTADFVEYVNRMTDIPVDSTWEYTPLAELGG
jgi:hypothetical protein